MLHAHAACPSKNRPYPSYPKVYLHLELEENCVKFSSVQSRHNIWISFHFISIILDSLYISSRFPWRVHLITMCFASIQSVSFSKWIVSENLWIRNHLQLWVDKCSMVSDYFYKQLAYWDIQFACIISNGSYKELEVLDSLCAALCWGTHLTAPLMLSVREILNNIHAPRLIMPHSDSSRNFFSVYLFIQIIPD